MLKPIPKPEPDAAPSPGKRPRERRRFSRVKIALLGRYMLSSRQEFPCQSVDLSPGGAAVLAPVKGTIGERVVLYLEHLGRIEGQITRHFENGFAISISATPRKRDKLAAQLTWLANRQSLGLPEDRRHERIVPRNPRTTMRTKDGDEAVVRLVDVSMSGAAVASELRPPIDMEVVIGQTQARVVRHIEDGIAVEFVHLLSPDDDDGTVDI
jgi:hypothetical protein